MSYNVQQFIKYSNNHQHGFMFEMDIPANKLGEFPGQISIPCIGYDTARMQVQDENGAATGGIAVTESNFVGVAGAAVATHTLVANGVSALQDVGTPGAYLHIDISGLTWAASGVLKIRIAFSE